MTMYDRWRDDDEAGGGLTTGPVSLVAIATGLACYGEPGPLERLFDLPDEDNEAFERWKEWMRRYLRRRAEAAEERERP